MCYSISVDTWSDSSLTSCWSPCIPTYSRSTGCRTFTIFRGEIDLQSLVVQKLFQPMPKNKQPQQQIIWPSEPISYSSGSYVMELTSLWFSILELEETSKQSTQASLGLLRSSPYILLVLLSSVSSLQFFIRSNGSGVFAATRSTKSKSTTLRLLSRSLRKKQELEENQLMTKTWPSRLRNFLQNTRRLYLIIRVSGSMTSIPIKEDKKQH